MPSYSRQTSYSRLQRRQDRANKWQSVLFIVAAFGLVAIFLYFGINFLFNLTSKISGLTAKDGASQTEQIGLAPNSPRLSQDLTATFSAQINVTGVADPHANVQLFQNGTPVGSNASDDQGKFNFLVTLDKGNNVFVAQATSTKGIKSGKSSEYNVMLVTTQPKLEITSPKDADKVSDTPINLSGKTDQGDSVSVNGHLIVVNSDGTFFYVLNLVDGDNKIHIVASDPAGNQTVKDMTVNYSH